MTLGTKIRKYRNLKGLTQKELGQIVGFSAATADSRIRKYESDIMAPKKDLREKLANALDVDISALSDTDISSNEDVMQALFQLEEELGLKIERTEDKTSLVFQNSKIDHQELISYLYAWYIQKEALPPETDETYENALRQYNQWKARFPMDIKQYWEEQSNAVTALYAPLVASLSSSKKGITRLSDFIKHIQMLIRCGIHIEPDSAHYGIGDGALVLTFAVSEMLESDETTRNAFTEVLFDIKTMEQYGVTYYTTLSSSESGTKISYTLRWSVLTPLKSTITSIQKHESKKESLSDFEIDSFEKNLANELNLYNIDLVKEIGRGRAKK